MDAKKCDRCGKLYESKAPEFTQIGSIYTYGIAWELHITNRSIDLCPYCLNDFKKWFESEVEE